MAQGDLTAPWTLFGRLHQFLVKLNGTQQAKHISYTDGDFPMKWTRLTETAVTEHDFWENTSARLVASKQL